jgi:hypothetical protein
MGKGEEWKGGEVGKGDNSIREIYIFITRK